MKNPPLIYLFSFGYELRKKLPVIEVHEINPMFLGYFFDFFLVANRETYEGNLLTDSYFTQSLKIRNERAFQL